MRLYCWRWTMKFGDGWMDIDQLFLTRLQYELTKNTYDDRRYSIGERPGEYKKHDYVTGCEEVGALPAEAEFEMSELLSDLAETNLESP